MRQKHRNDYAHGKNGWVGGNPRYGKARGHRRGQRVATNLEVRKMASKVTERWLTVVPAYGRDYANAAQVKAHWDKNLDFFICDISCKYDGKCINAEDAVGNYDVIKVRFQRLEEFCLIRWNGKWNVEDCTEPAE